MRTPSGAAPCELSVVVCTFNRAELLGRALDALSRQTLDPGRFEIIVVDNNSNDSTPAVVHDRAARAPNIRFTLERRQGLPFARNSGVRAARAPLIAFTDDDVEVRADWTARVLAAFTANPDVGCLGGKVVAIWDGTGRPTWVPDGHYGPLALQDRGDRPLSVGAHDVRPCLIGANFAVRRSVFDRVGLFSTAFPWGEDREFQLRAWEAGVLGLYVPDVIATCRVPAERLTKRYQRRWFAKAGRVHSRMQLLERMDRQGRLVPPVRGRPVLGMPGYLVRDLGLEIGRWLQALVLFRTVDAFHAENRIRYRFSYLAERRRHPLPAKPLDPEAPSPAGNAISTPGSRLESQIR